jgi:hypothetical protein
LMMPIADYAFEGPYRSVEKIEDSPGVFLVMCELAGKYYLLDVDHSDEMRKAIQNHERRSCWEKHRRGPIKYAIHYTGDMSPGKREKIEKKIRREYKTIPCPAHPTEAPR